MSGLNLSLGARRNREGSNTAPDLMSHVRLPPISDDSEKSREKINTKKSAAKLFIKGGKKKSSWPL